MTYRCGMGAGMQKFGLEPGPPHIYCDACGLKLEARSTRGFGAPAWLLSGKAPKGWACAVQKENGIPITRQDWCPRCRGRKPRCCDECAQPGCGNVGQEMTTLCDRFVRAR